MEKKDFLQLCWSVFKANEFHRKGNNFYYNLDNGIILQYSLQKSSYGAYYYIEYGYDFSEINPYMPMPGQTHMCIRCGRIERDTEIRKDAWNYEAPVETNIKGKVYRNEIITEKEINQVLLPHIQEATQIGKKGKFYLKQLLLDDAIKYSNMADYVVAYLDLSIDRDWRCYRTFLN